MALRAVKHKFTGVTTSIASYDSTKTNLGSLMFQQDGTDPADKYIGPLPVGMTRPMQEVVVETVGTVAVTTTNITGTSTNFTSAMVGMMIGFGSANPAQVTSWYTIATVVAASGTNCATINSIGATPIASGTAYVIVSNIPLMYPHAIHYSSTIDWIFLVENLATSVAPRKICLYEYNKTTSVYAWKGFIIITLLSTAAANTIRGFRALRYLHTSGMVTVDVDGVTVNGVSTNWQIEGLAVGARIGFGSTDPTLIADDDWFVISAISSDILITLATSAGARASTAYVIEELRFALAITQATAVNGGLFLVKGVNYSDFAKAGTTAERTIPAATSTDNVKAVYWLSDAGTTANVVTNTSACGCTVAAEVNKGLHYAYVLDGFASLYVRVLRYNLRATGAVASGKMTLSVAYTTAGTVTIAANGTTVTGDGTAFTAAMIGMKIGFGSTSPALITAWYTIASWDSATAITLTASAGAMSVGTAYIVDSADVISTGSQLVTGTMAGVSNGRIGTLHHGPGAEEESLYFVTITRIYRAALSKIFSGNLGWIAENRPELPPGGINSYPAASLLSSVEIADSIDRLIVMSTGGTAVRHYVTRYNDESGVPYDHIFGIDDKQQDQILTNGDAYIISGTAATNGTAVTGTATFFTIAMIGFRIKFGSINPNAAETWYTISAVADWTHLTLSADAGIRASGAYVIDINSNTVTHFNTSSQVNSVWSQNGIAHIAKHGTTAALCQLYALPFSAHWTYAATTDQRVITPVIYTPDCASFHRVVVTDIDRLGDSEFSITPEPWRMYFRTNNIDSNEGEWTLVGKDGDLSGLIGARRIQFMFEFVTIGWMCMPARIMSLTVFYDDTATKTDSHYQPSVAKSDVAGKQFAWRFATAFSGTVPTLRVRLYNAVNGILLVDDYSVNASGTWKQTTDGSTWEDYTTANKTNETTYIRYTPASLGDNIKVRAILTQ